MKELLNSDIPVIVYVYPRGATATSAGVFITLSAHVAAMSPGTSIGAAHPVMLGRGQKGPGKPEDKKDDKSSDVMNEKDREFRVVFYRKHSRGKGKKREVGRRFGQKKRFGDRR